MVIADHRKSLNGNAVWSIARRRAADLDRDGVARCGQSRTNLDRDRRVPRRRIGARPRHLYIARFQGRRRRIVDGDSSYSTGGGSL